MPKAMEMKLMREADMKGMKCRKKAAYVYGNMNNMGLMHGNKTTAKGKKAKYGR